MSPVGREVQESLQGIMDNPVRSRQQISAMPMVVAITLQISRALSPQSALFTPDGPMGPLLGNPALSFSTLLQSVSVLQNKLPVIHPLLSPMNLLPFEDLVPESARSIMSRFQYLQLHHFYQRHKATPYGIPYETLCLQSDPQRHAISLLYSFLIEPLTLCKATRLGT